MVFNTAIRVTSKLNIKYPINLNIPIKIIVLNKFFYLIYKSNIFPIGHFF